MHDLNLQHQVTIITRGFMDTFIGILVIVLSIFALFSIIFHLIDYRKLKKKHIILMSKLSPSRTIRNIEIERFKEVFKKDLAPSTKVFKHRGIVSYISVTANHVEHKYFTIGEIRIHLRCYSKLSNKKVGLILDDYLPGPDYESELDKLEEQFNAENMSEGKLQQELLTIRAKYEYDFEFVFLKEDNVQKQTAFLISFDKWKLADF